MDWVRCGACGWYGLGVGEKGVGTVGMRREEGGGWGKREIGGEVGFWDGVEVRVVEGWRLCWWMMTIVVMVGRWW